jgi:hypothetical protein
VFSFILVLSPAILLANVTVSKTLRQSARRPVGMVRPGVGLTTKQQGWSGGFALLIPFILSPSQFRPSPGAIHPSNPAMCPLFIPFFPASVKKEHNETVVMN